MEKENKCSVNIFFECTHDSETCKYFKKAPEGTADSKCKFCKLDYDCDQGGDWCECEKAIKEAEKLFKKAQKTLKQ